MGIFRVYNAETAFSGVHRIVVVSTCGTIGEQKVRAIAMAHQQGFHGGVQAEPVELGPSGVETTNYEG